MVRADLKISNIFGLRPTGTDFFVGSTITQFTHEDWGDDTIGQLMANDQSGVCDQNPWALGWKEIRERLARSFDLKLELRFPPSRFQGNCVISRLGHRL